MRILLTGYTGYIAQRLLPVLVAQGHTIVCCVRDLKRFKLNPQYTKQVSGVEVDFLKPDTLFAIPTDIDVAYYLIHSMSSSSGDFTDLEQQAAHQFVDCINKTQARQIIFLSGIVNKEHLSKHLSSRKNVESILSTSTVPLTTLRAGIIIGSGSASFEIMRDLVEKLPLMIAPRWLSTLCQPIAIRNVVELLSKVLLLESALNANFDIGGPDVLTYKQMLLQFAEVRKLRRRIYVVPVMTPKLSSYWLYFVTSTSYRLAVNLVDSMKVDVVCRPNTLVTDLKIHLIPYEQAIRLAFDKIEQNDVLSSWTDALSSDTLYGGISSCIEVPSMGCFFDKSEMLLDDPALALQNIWRIGGDRGWYYADFLWRIRGFLDTLAGGVGLRRGRRSETEICAGDALDFWRVILANKEEKRLLLYAEMKLPGEAWLEFKITNQTRLVQTATFRPRGIWGRMYWYSLLPFHGFIFKGMLRNIATRND
jgi:uncharacterized protein YbjT (DUF2867 family)